MRFREKAIGVTSDIRRAFLQIGISREDQNYLKFLWWENNKIVEFRHKRVVFGVTSSPYLLAAVISFHLENVHAKFEIVAEKLLHAFYVDNCVTSVDTNVELEVFIQQATAIMADAKMELRMWTFGPEQELSLQNVEPISPVLGLQWDHIEDSLFIPFKSEPIADLSKRKLLSIVHSVFDPLGFVVPVMVPAKLILQEAWATEANWDLPLPDELQSRFSAWYHGLSCISQLKFERRIGYGKRDSWSLHIFCDASKNAYATVIFLRSESSGQVYVKFVAAKSRISPLKKVTIPRLELLACVLGSRLAKYVVTALSLREVPTYYWTDATVALCWIQREENWGVFVNNRVKEIRSLSKKEYWRHIPGKLNPADIASRGCTLQHLSQYGWWEGPEFLKASPEAWPKSEFSPNEELIAAEMKKKIIVDLSVKIEKPEWFERFSSFSKIVRVFCWMIRFEKENSVHGLQVVRGDDDVLRVKTRIIERDDDLSFLYPILLPSKHYLTECLIREYHLKYCHAGVQILAAKLRLQYWIFSSKRNIRSCVSRCVVCKRFTAKALTTPPIQLPLDRKAKATCQELKVGDIVLIELENKKRVMWPMGKIEKIYSSRDGASRVVRVRTSSGCLTRPIQKLYPLEVSTSGDPVLTLTTENRSRYGRLYKSSKK
ncbi:reverse transcriptase [Caerostris extrusa]|uniref:Reverse transcriptase n=2 Tax=Caerostris extrusa TaxID=172846 RepID=A0AAV4T8V8_CAEEX|nr:reverse transcriptase [Caerostris extrusa]